MRGKMTISEIISTLTSYLN